jgi:hypothetical protein
MAGVLPTFDLGLGILFLPLDPLLIPDIPWDALLSRIKQAASPSIESHLLKSNLFLPNM